jgi:hypothetical protein
VAFSHSSPNGPSLCERRDDDVGRGFGPLMLPDTHHRPSLRPKPPVSVAVATTVAGELGGPELGVRLRVGGVLWAGVPEAAIDEHSNSLTREDDVGPSASVELEGPVHPIPKAAAM